MSRKKYVYLYVTKDKFELPIIVADSLEELASKCGVTKHAISTGIYHEKKFGKKSRYKRVERE